MKKILSLALLILLSATCIFGQSKVLDGNSGLFIYLKGSNTKITEDDYLIYAKGFGEIVKCYGLKLSCDSFICSISKGLSRRCSNGS